MYVLLDWKCSRSTAAHESPVVPQRSHYGRQYNFTNKKLKRLMGGISGSQGCEYEDDCLLGDRLLAADY